MRLLVVEDESLLRQQLEQGLTKQGYVVDVAEDGKIGLYHAIENDFDVAIIDLGLPEIDGISLIQQIRAAGKEYPILILTARGDWQNKVAGLDAGADDYVVKPFQLEEKVMYLVLDQKLNLRLTVKLTKMMNGLLSKNSTLFYIMKNKK